MKYLALGELLVLTLGDAHGQDKDCRVSPDFYKSYPEYRGAKLETPTRNPLNWRGGWNYEHIFKVARETIDDFWNEDALFSDFEALCVYTVEGYPHGRGHYRGVATVWTNPSTYRTQRAIHYNLGSSDGAMWAILHELGHHISSYLVVGTPRPEVVRRAHRLGTRIEWPSRAVSHVIEKHADFWAGAIAQRLNKYEPGRWEINNFAGLHWARSTQPSATHPSLRTRREMKLLGWEHAEFGDTPLWYYGNHELPVLYDCPHVRGRLDSTVVDEGPFYVE